MGAIAFNTISIPFWREGEKTLPFLMILLQVKGGHNCFQSNVYFIYSRARKNELVSLSNILVHKLGVMVAMVAGRGQSGQTQLYSRQC